MTYFEFSLIPVAIVIGFALSSILNCLALVIQNWKQHKQHALFVSFMLMVMLALVSHFAADWVFREMVHTHTRLLLVVVPTFVLVLAASLMFPQNGQLISNLDEHYFENISKASVFFSIGIILAAIPDTFEEVLNPLPYWQSALFICLFILMAITKNKAAHVATHAVLWLGLVARIYLGFG